MRPRCGIDVGQAVDPTAIAVVEPYWDEAIEDVIYRVRRMERIPLGTDYLVVGDRVAEIVGNLHRLTTETVDVFIDFTGVGRPVFNILQKKLKGIPCRIFAVSFTSGDNLRATEQGDPAAMGGRQSVRSERYYTVGKGYLVSRLKALLQTGRVKGKATAEFVALQGELTTFEIRARAGGGEQSGAFRSGTHDDLCVALALAVLIEAPGATGRTDLTEANLQLGQSAGHLRRRML